MKCCRIIATLENGEYVYCNKDARFIVPTFKDGNWHYSKCYCEEHFIAPAIRKE